MFSVTSGRRLSGIRWILYTKYYTNNSRCIFIQNEKKEKIRNNSDTTVLAYLYVLLFIKYNAKGCTSEDMQ